MSDFSCSKATKESGILCAGILSNGKRASPEEQLGGPYLGGKVAHACFNHANNPTIWGRSSGALEMSRNYSIVCFCGPEALKTTLHDLGRQEVRN